MARQRFEFTRDRVDKATCPPGKSQALYWDSEQPGLGLRVTAGGAKSFIFESKLGRQTIRVTIGPASMPIRAAKDKTGKPVTAGANIEAARLAALVAQGIDPRVEKAQRIAEQAANRAAAKAEKAKHDIIALDAWSDYCDARRQKWSERHHAEHLAYASPGGIERKRAKGLTKPGALYSLLNRPLASIDGPAVEQWVQRETQTRPATAALGFRLLRGFINWCARRPEYRGIVAADACASREARETIGQPRAKTDALQREQLPAWFGEVRKLPPIHAAYLQALLLTGARRVIAGVKLTH